MSEKVKKRRLDELVVERGLADSRSQAKALILAGQIRSGTEVLDKAGKVYPADIPLERPAPPRFVSRAGEKLAGFLEAFPLPVEGRRVLDLGASTGGFTDCLLQQGAAHATCVDVGRAQLHGKVGNDARVTSFEGLNARHLKPGDLPHNTYEIVVMDLSFISLRSILPVAWSFLAPGGHLVALIKPQFEAGKEEADKGRGIIRDSAVRQRVVDGIRHFCRDELPGSEEIGLIKSPIQGTGGNVEYLIGLRKAAQ